MKVFKQLLSDYTYCLLRGDHFDGAAAYLVLVAEYEQATRRAPAEPVPQWGKAGTCEWYDGYADHSDGGGPYKERVLYTAPQASAPVKLPEPCGIFNYGKDDRKPTYHHGQTDKEWLNKVLDDGVTGGPHRSEYAYTEQQVRTLLAAAPSKPLTDAQIKEGRDAVNDDPDYRPEPWAFRKGVKFAERMHGITKDQP